MRYSTTLAATALVAAAPSLAGSKSYSGNAVVVNKCDYDLHLWSVDNYYKSEMITIKAGNTYSEPLRIPDTSADGGVSLKVSKGKSINRPIVQFEYTISPASSDSDRFVSYDVSFVDCSTSEPSVAAVDGYTFFSGSNCPAWDQGISVTGTGSGCEEMSCAPSDFCYLAAYFEPEPAALTKVQPVRQCPKGDLTSDIVFTACTSNEGDSSDSYSSASSSSSATPSSSSSEVAPSTSSSTPSTPSSSPAAQTSSSSTSSEVSAAEFAPVDASYASSSTPAVTPAPSFVDGGVYTAVVYETVFATLYVDPEGDRVNPDGSVYVGRRFAA